MPLDLHFKTLQAARLLLAAVFFTVAVGSAASHAAESASAPANAPTNKGCLIFDATMYTHKPDLQAEGFVPLTIVYEGALWEKGAAMDQLPTKARVLQKAKLAADAHQLFVLDIERWPIDSGISDEDVERNMSRLLEVLGWVRAAYPQLKVGYFGVLPSAAVTDALAPPGSSRRAAWHKANMRLTRLAREVDVVLPYIYTYSEDTDRWVRVAMENIREARQYSKPVYVFLWPQYSEKNPALNAQFVTAGMWQAQLSTACMHADGVVIWGGWDGTKRAAATWDADAEWWSVTRSFLSRRPANGG